MTVSRDTAIEMAQRKLVATAKFIGEEVIVGSVQEFPNDWVIDYNTRTFIETGNASHALAGAGPIIINKTTGELTVGTPTLSIEEQVAGTEITNDSGN